MKKLIMENLSTYSSRISIRQFERINKKKYVDKKCLQYSIKYVSMKKFCPNIYIYMCVCVCVCVCVHVYMCVCLCIYIYTHLLGFLCDDILYHFISDGLQNRSERVRIPVALLRSLSGKYPWERYEPPYPSSYGLNSTTTVLLGEWLWH